MNYEAPIVSLSREEAVVAVVVVVVVVAF